MRLLAVMVAVLGAALAPSVSASERASGLTPATVPGYRIALGIPAGWVGSKPPSSLSRIGVKYLYKAPQATGGFQPNLNLIVQPLRGMTLREWFFQGPSNAMQYIGKTTYVSIGGLRALHYVSTRVFKSLLTDQYAFARGGNVYLFTYSALASTRAHYEPIFTASGSSIRFH